MDRRTWLSRVMVGTIALALWFVLFSAGLLIETVEQRAVLAPHSFLDLAKTDAASGIKPHIDPDARLVPFVQAALCFTPTNLALLAVLAGLLGGCASKFLVEGMPAERVRMIAAVRLQYLDESPWSAMIRSFVVYLCVIAGLYFAIDDPFKNPTPAQYTRLAGTVSILALVVGYDPTRLPGWLGVIPTPQSQKATVKEDHQGNLKVELAQGPAVVSANGEPTKTSLDLADANPEHEAPGPWPDGKAVAGKAK